MKLVERVLAVGWIAHILEAVQRFFERFGIQFAGAITYFSVLSMVPILMVAFAAAGFTLTVFLPDMLDEVQAWMLTTVDLHPDSVLGGQILSVIDQAFNSWRAVGIIGLGGAAWAGAKWVMHLQIGIRAQLRTSFDLQQTKKLGFFRQLARELGTLFGLFLLVGVTMVASSVATLLRGFVSGLLAVTGLPAPEVGSVLASVLATGVGGFTLFWFLFTVTPERRVPLHVRAQGTVIGALGLVALEYAAGFLLAGFADSAAATVFGSVIVLMLFLNLFASLILIVAAWIATHPDYREPAPSPSALSPDAPSAPDTSAPDLSAPPTSAPPTSAPPTLARTAGNTPVADAEREAIRAEHRARQRRRRAALGVRASPGIRRSRNPSRLSG